MIQEQTKSYIDAMSDEQVYVYASDTTGTYAAEAVAYAKEVMARRGLTPERVVELQAAKARQLCVEQQEREADAKAPLSMGKRVAFFFLGMLGFPLIVVLVGYVRYSERGQRRRFAEMMAAMGAGFAVMLAIVMAMGFAVWAVQGV